MKKILLSCLSILLAVSASFILKASAEENTGTDTSSNLETSSKLSEATTANDGTELFTDTNSISDVNEDLASMNSFQVVNEIEVNKNEDGVEVGVTETGDLEIHVTDPETLKDIDAQIKNDSSEPVEGTLLEYSLHVPEENIDSYIGNEEDIYTNTEENAEVTDNEDDATMNAQWGNGLYIKNKNSSYKDGDVIRKSKYQGPSEPKMIVSESSAYTYSGTGGFDVKTVAVQLGFEYQKTKMLTDEYSLKVPKGKTIEVTAKEYDRNYTFEVWEDPWIGGDHKVSNGKVKRPLGVSFYQRTL
ncbi:hypothetical protein [Bacillus sp. AFS017336]|uniref:hypothetical protein n=1 Tax=Bacillus sp. AFS017336 TaxID=2033489 RepID=UPI000BEF25F8|nr:hypothetical protein [Bacillus sp. AFS017336]PEL03308.1 hypothetical protein CN601_21965 [Bacillus sp. AFS017336]